MLQRKPITITTMVWLARCLNLDAVNLFTRVDQAIIRGVVTERNRDVVTELQSARVEELLAGSAYCFAGDDERIPWSLSNNPSGISLNHPCCDPRLQRMSITAPLVFADISSAWN
jgi:hypothetical protein